MESALLVLALGFIDTAIRSRGDETKDGIFGVDATMCLITFGTVNTHHIMRYYLRPVVNHEYREHESLVCGLVWSGCPGSPYFEPDRLGPNISFSAHTILILPNALPNALGGKCTHGSTQSVLLLRSSVISPCFRKIPTILTADVGSYSYGLGHPMKPLRMRITHELLTAYDMLGKMDVLVCHFLSLKLLSETLYREQSVQLLKP